MITDEHTIPYDLFNYFEEDKLCLKILKIKKPEWTF